MTTHAAVVARVVERRALRMADVEGDRTARGEDAAIRQLIRARNLAGDGDEFDLLLVLAHAGHAIKQAAGVGMQGQVVQIGYGRVFYQFPRRAQPPGRTSA